MKRAIFHLLLLATLPGWALSQSVQLAEGFESTVPGTLPVGWSSDLPSIASVGPTALTGFGSRALLVQGVGSPAAGILARSPVFAPTPRGRVSFDVAVGVADGQLDVVVRDGVGVVCSIVRLDPQGSLLIYEELSTGVFDFVPTGGTYSLGVPTRILIDYPRGVLEQDGSVITTTNSLSFTTSGAVGPVQLEVSLSGSQGGHESVTLDNFLVQDCPRPVSYCPGAPNSVSPSNGAQMYFIGSTFLEDDWVSFAVFGLPAQVPLLMFHGGATASVPLGDGTLCIGPGAQGLYRGAIGMSGSTNPPFSVSSQAQLTVDLNAVPYASGPGAILMGSTWNFQAAYRDSTTFGAGFNYTNAMTLVFCQ